VNEPPLRRSRHGRRVEWPGDPQPVGAMGEREDERIADGDAIGAGPVRVAEPRMGDKQASPRLHNDVDRLGPQHLLSYQAQDDLTKQKKPHHQPDGRHQREGTLFSF